MVRSRTSSVTRVASTAKFCDLAFTPCKPFNQFIGHIDHRCRKIHHRLTCEKRRQRSPLRPPLVPLYCQESARETWRQHAPLKPVLPVVVGIFEQNAADRSWITYHRDPPNRYAGDDDWLVEMCRCPRLDRVVG